MLSRANLRTYQEKIANRILLTKKIGVFAEMRLGKTVSTLTAIVDLFSRFEINKVLILAPKLVAHKVWHQEIKKWGHTQWLKSVIVDGSPFQRKKQIDSEYQVYVISITLLDWLTEHFNSKRWPFDMVVIDESSLFKSSSTKRFKTFKKILNKIDRLVLLSGTPVTQSIENIWSQIYLLDGGKRLGRSLWSFRANYFYPSFCGYNYTPKKESPSIIANVIKDITVSLSAKDYVSLSPTLTNDIPVNLTPYEMTKYKQFKRHNILNFSKDESVCAVNSAVLINKLKQFVDGSLYTETKALTTSKQKQIVLLNMLSKMEGLKIVICYSFREDNVRLLKVIRKHSVFTPINIVEKESINRFNNEKDSILLAQPQSASYGIDLKKADAIIWYGIPWSFELYHQMNARLSSTEKKKPVFVYRLVASKTVDALIIQRLNGRLSDLKEFMRKIKLDDF